MNFEHDSITKVQSKVTQKSSRWFGHQIFHSNHESFLVLCSGEIGKTDNNLKSIQETSPKTVTWQIIPSHSFRSTIFNFILIPKRTKAILSREINFQSSINFSQTLLNSRQKQKKTSAVLSRTSHLRRTQATYTTQFTEKTPLGKIYLLPHSMGMYVIKMNAYVQSECILIFIIRPSSCISALMKIRQLSLVKPLIQYHAHF